MHNRCVSLFACVILLLANACGASETRKRLSDLKTKEVSIQNELGLWQSQLDDMEKIIKDSPKPGTRHADGIIIGRGFSKDFIKRRNDLRDRVTQLKADLFRVRAEREQLEKQ